MHGVTTIGETFPGEYIAATHLAQRTKPVGPEVHKDTLGLDVLYAEGRANRAASGFTFLDEATQVSAIDFCMPYEATDIPQQKGSAFKEQRVSFGDREAHWSSHATKLADQTWKRLVLAPADLRKGTNQAIERTVGHSRALVGWFRTDLARGMVPTSKTPFLDWLSDNSKRPLRDPAFMMELIRTNRAMTVARNSDPDVQEVLQGTKMAWAETIPDLVDDGVLHPSVLKRLGRIANLKIFVGDDFATLARGNMGYARLGEEAVVVEKRPVEDYASTDGQLLIFHEINHILGWGGLSRGGKCYEYSFDHPIHNEADTQHLAEVQVHGHDAEVVHCDTGIYDFQKLLRARMVKEAQRRGAQLTMRDFLYAYSSPHAERRRHMEHINWELAGSLGISGDTMRSVVISAELIAEERYKPGLQISKEVVAIGAARIIAKHFAKHQQLP